MAELCGEIDKHLEEIERLQAEAKKSGEDISGAFDGFAGAPTAEVAEDAEGTVETAAEPQAEANPETPTAE